MERERERGRERARGHVQAFHRRHRSFHRSAIGSRRGSTVGYHGAPRGQLPRGRLQQISRRPSTSRPRNYQDTTGFYDGSSKPAQEANRPLPRETSGHKKSFRDLFSEKDTAEGGAWTEVKRRKQPPPQRHRSPIIKHPCFRCGLGGHFRRDCPRRSNMRCYGCSSLTHQVKDCMHIRRPEEQSVELTNVFDINDKVQSLNNFAIFRARGHVNALTLNEALKKGVWPTNWQGKIIPIEKNSFLVGFVNEFRRDMAVLAGRIMFEGFSGTFYAWNEDRGATKVCKPVIVWITLVDLPLHFWGKEEITSIFAPFGKIHKFHPNLFTKKQAAVVRVMVEVEDIEAVPKTVKCSYKSVVDNKVRYYTVKLVPYTTCLPVSQWTEGGYKDYVELGGRMEVGEGVEEGWEYGTEGTWRGGVGRRSGEREEEEAEFQEVRAEEGANAAATGVRAGYAGTGVGADVAAGARERTDDGAGEMPLNAEQHAPAEHAPVPETHVPADETEGARERRRKGKDVCMEWAPVNLNTGPDPVASGSGSCDPLRAEDRLAKDKMEESLEDADSKAGPMRGPMGGQGEADLGSIKEKPIPISEGGQQDEDMGGEGYRLEKVGQEADSKVEESMVEAKLKSMEKKRGVASGQEKRGSRGSTGSVPPGFSRLPRSAQGASSPFGKFQRGGLKFLKRPASSAGSTGAKKGPSAPSSKKTRPIESMSSKDIAEVACNVGVAERLTEEQIRRLKQQEKDQASS